MGSFSIFHWLIVLFVVVLLFGPRRLPELAKGMGEAIREFKKALKSTDGTNAPITAETKSPDSLPGHHPEKTASSLDHAPPGNRGS